MKKRFEFIELGFDIEAKDTARSFYNQVHGSDILEVKDDGHLAELYRTRPPADGAFTRAKLELCVFTADCLPLIYFTESADGPIGVAHSGWRSAMQRIGAKMLPHFPANTHVALGPCILPCCFEVKEDFIQTFQNHQQDPLPFLTSREAKLFFDLPAFVVATQLKSTTIHRDFLRCTVCSAPTLPSYRRQKSTNPRIRGWIRKP